MTTPRERLAKVIDQRCERDWHRVSDEGWEIWCQSHHTYIGTKTEAEAENVLCPTALAIADAILSEGGQPPGFEEEVRDDIAREIEAEQFKVESIHRFHGTTCLCGFDSQGRARSATEHITQALSAASIARGVESGMSTTPDKVALDRLVELAEDRGWSKGFDQGWLAAEEQARAEVAQEIESADPRKLARPYAISSDTERIIQSVQSNLARIARREK